MADNTVRDLANSRSLSQERGVCSPTDCWALYDSDPNRKLLITVALTGTLLTGAAAFALPVLVPNGGSVSVCKFPPILPTDPAAPASAKSTFKPGRPPAFEEDVAFDDMLGAASFSPLFGACITISDSGGDLFTPTSGDLNGGLEGDCIEVFFCFDYCRFEPMPLAGGGIAWVPVADVACTDICEVCPDPW